MGESLMDKSCRDFAESLGARRPVPGGGSAAAFVGALGSALCEMVANYDVEKPSLADHKDELQHAIDAAIELRAELLELVEEDVAAYELVSAAYALPRGSAERADAIEAALQQAVVPPCNIMVACTRAIALLEELSHNCSRLLLSDVGCGAMLCRGALDAASLTVCVNTASMRDRERAAEIEDEREGLLAKWGPRAQALADRAVAVMKGEV